MLKKLTLIHFQSHRKTELEFVPGVNVIVGRSDTGKTSILRALRWAATNKPNGDAFRSHWAAEKTTRVSLTTEEGFTIRRSKAKNTNEYLLETPEGSELFRAFGQGVPPAILKVLNLSEINFSRQMDAPFLLSDSPGEVAQTLNNTVGLDIIDASARFIKKELRQVSSEIEGQKSLLAETEEALATFSGLPALESELERLEALETEVVTAFEGINNLLALFEALKSTNQQLRHDFHVLAYQSTLEQLREQAALLQQEKKEKIEPLSAILTALADVLTSEEQNAIPEKAEELLNELLKKEKRVEEQANGVMDLRYLLKDIEAQEEQLKKTAATLQKLKTAWKKNMPETCPLCGHSR